MKQLVGLFGSNEGQSLTEYGLILALFVVFVIFALMILGPKITELYTDANNQIN